MLRQPAFFVSVPAAIGPSAFVVMMVGALTTLYVLLQLAVRLLVEIGKWMP